MESDVVRGVEDHGILDAHSDQVCDAEESAVIDFGVDVLPVRQHVGLFGEQAVEVSKTRPNSALPVKDLQVLVNERPEGGLIVVKFLETFLDRADLQAALARRVHRHGFANWHGRKRGDDP